MSSGLCEFFFFFFKRASFPLANFLGTAASFCLSSKTVALKKCPFMSCFLMHFWGVGADAGDGQHNKEHLFQNGNENITLGC